MATGKQLKTANLARRAAKGPRKKCTRPEPRQYTVADLERARDRVAAAERRIDNDRRSNPYRGHTGLERAQLKLSVIESQLRLRGAFASGRSGPRERKASQPCGRDVVSNQRRTPIRYDDPDPDRDDGGDDGDDGGDDATTYAHWVLQSASLPGSASPASEAF